MTRFDPSDDSPHRLGDYLRHGGDDLRYAGGYLRQRGGDLGCSSNDPNRLLDLLAAAKPQPA